MFDTGSDEKLNRIIELLETKVHDCKYRKMLDRLKTEMGTFGTSTLFFEVLGKIEAEMEKE